MEECKTTNQYLKKIVNDTHGDMMNDLENVCRKRQTFLNNHSKRMEELNEALESLNRTIDGDDQEILSELDRISNELDELLK